MHNVIFNPLRLDGAERSGSEMKRKVDAADPTSRQSRKELSSKMKSGCWRGHGTGPFGIDGLIRVSIADRFAPMPDVRRQWSLAVFFQ
jgi:hypothetical protein